MAVPEPYSISWLAANLNVTRRALEKAVKRLEPAEVIERKDRTIRKYFIADAARAMFEPEEKPDYMREKAALTRIQKQKAELDLKKAQGELVELEQVQSIYVGEVHHLKQRIFAVPSRVAPYLVGHESAQEIESQITDALHEQFEEFSTGDQDSGDAPDAENSESVG